MRITSKEIFLRSLEIEDLHEFYDWSKDSEITQYSLSAYNYPQSKTDISKWLASVNDSDKVITFGICCLKTNKLIGYTGIASISYLNRSGEYFILIGDKKYWNKGIGTDVTKIITKYGFDTIGLHRLELTAFSLNSAATKAYVNAGYQLEGILRESVYRNGEFLDKVLMSILSSEKRK